MVEAVKPIVIFLDAKLTSVLVEESHVLDTAIASAFALVIVA